MNKIFTILGLCALTFYSCTKECCYDGNPIDPELSEIVINENENEDDTFDAKILAKVTCLDNQLQPDISLNVTDSNGEHKRFSSDENGTFLIGTLPAGSYTLKFSNPQLYNYTDLEYTAIITKLRAIILGIDTATNMEKIAFNIANHEDGLTTLDLTIFQQLASGAKTLSEIDVPWRYVLTSELNSSESITDSITINLLRAQEIQLDISAIYFGDALGTVCL